ncbi:MAG: hypothetical protein WBA00_13720 [Rhodococcus sp. (in: high G+C Gram-positive bacteria)]
MDDAIAARRSDSTAVAAARTYLRALVTHDVTGLRFEPAAVRLEFGLRTGKSGPRMMRDLARGRQYRVIQGIRELHITESGDSVLATYLLDAGFGRLRLCTVSVVERFEVVDGSIAFVAARIRPRSIL